MKLKKTVPIGDSDFVNELMDMFINHFEYSIDNINSYEELAEEEKKIIPKRLFDMIVEPPAENLFKERKVANVTILRRLGQIVDQYPYLRFQQILTIYKISEACKDKFNEESVETLQKLEHELR